MINYRGPSPDQESREGEYIPVDIEDCMRELCRVLSPELIAEIKNFSEAELVKYHFSVGQGLRNSWGLWKDSSRLNLYFRQIGLSQADDMSSIILGVYLQSALIYAEDFCKPIQQDRHSKSMLALFDSAGIEMENSTEEDE